VSAENNEETSGELVFLICCGMYRSASTWQYLVASEIVETNALGQRIGFIHGDAFDEADYPSASEGRLLVLKCHDYHPVYGELVRKGRAKVIYSYRDIRDVACSLMWKLNFSFEQVVESEAFRQALRSYYEWTSLPGALRQSYDAIVGQPTRSAQEIADHLGLPLDDAAAGKIAEKYGREANLARANRLNEALARQGVDMSLPESMLLHDPETLLHWNHIRPAPWRSWRELLGLREVNLLDPVVSQWLVDSRLEPDGGWIARWLIYGMSQNLPLKAQAFIPAPSGAVSSRGWSGSYMPTERVIEIPWALTGLPQSGVILDVGSCDSAYLSAIQLPDRVLHCLDTRGCPSRVPPGAVFHHQSLIGNDLPRASFDAVLMLSVLEHIGLPCYGQEPFANGDELALSEAWALLRPGAPLLATVPVGQGKLSSWYRQYTPARLERLFSKWDHQIWYWGFDGEKYTPIEPQDVAHHDYRDRFDALGGAGAVACIMASASPHGIVGQSYRAPADDTPLGRRRPRSRK
jgi:hypothetical protein